ncbi:DUF397 domain-containing protein [Streptomyces sp. ISL-100]|uniref:DUF397 domain-containing protein n=1 Tax=Streptomyces sp. ISL-100 TaxID=2819173 RepID=UPI001BE7437C|nr:DUF397 domain-containing protein [Streptomyces sp. ISL-100]MBT2398714.1 DUF397 domain-containing protein [Streptomyces sp. ISL-100]
MSELHWQKSSFSVGEAGNCLYVAITPDGTIRLRESDNPEQIISANPARLQDLIRAIKADEFNQLAR